jgi:hypothetical protein
MDGVLVTIGSLWPHITHEAWHEVKWVSSRIENQCWMKGLLSSHLNKELLTRIIYLFIYLFSNFVLIFFGVPQPPPQISESSQIYTIKKIQEKWKVLFKNTLLLTLDQPICVCFQDSKKHKTHIHAKTCRCLSFPGWRVVIVAHDAEWVTTSTTMWLPSVVAPKEFWHSNGLDPCKSCYQLTTFYVFGSKTSGYVTPWHCHLHFKSILRQKKNYENSKYFTMQNI